MDRVTLLHAKSTTCVNSINGVMQYMYRARQKNTPTRICWFHTNVWIF